MTEPKKPDTNSVIQDAIRAKRDKTKNKTVDFATAEAELLADIESFDLEGAAREANQTANDSMPAAGRMNDALAYPEIISTGTFRTIADRPMSASQLTGEGAGAGGDLLARLRAEAERRQSADNAHRAQRNAISEGIDQALRKLFFYLHDMVQQLNIIKPVVPRSYPLIEDKGFEDLVWQEGFADYRTLAQSAGGFVELVSLSYQLSRPEAFRIRREALGVERFRNILFDVGLLFSCREYKDANRQLAYAEFEIPAQVAVNVRWRADFAKGVILLETRNLERLGSHVYTVQPKAVDQALCDEFTRLLLGQPNRFRELVKR